MTKEEKEQKFCLCCGVDISDQQFESHNGFCLECYPLQQIDSELDNNFN